MDKVSQGNCPISKFPTSFHLNLQLGFIVLIFCGSIDFELNFDSCLSNLGKSDKKKKKKSSELGRQGLHQKWSL